MIPILIALAVTAVIYGFYVAGREPGLLWDGHVERHEHFEWEADALQWSNETRWFAWYPVETPRGWTWLVEVARIREVRGWADGRYVRTIHRRLHTWVK